MKLNKTITFILSLVLLAVCLRLVISKKVDINPVFFDAKVYFDNDFEKMPSNVILISIDTLRADHLGCYGYPENTSPNIDSFSRDSVLFRKNIAQAPSTEPSHASIFTSLIPSHHGALYSTRSPIPAELTTMAEILKRNGYKTISYNGGAQLVAKFGFGQGFDLYDSFSDREDVSHDTFMKEVRLATGWIEKNPNEKFFFFLHTYETHHPYTPLKEDLDLLEKDYSGPLPANIPSELLRKINAGEVEIDLADQNHIISTYNAEIYSMDRAFGVLVDFLKKQNLYDNTLIIFTSDHGEEFEEHGMMGWHSHTLYDELLRVPLIIKFPNSEYAFTLIDEQTRNIDILPTMLDILNIPPLPQFEGESLLEWFSKTPRKQLLAISQLDADIQALPSSLRSDAYKLYNQELYDLKSDPLEHNDIARKNKKLFKSLQDELNSLLGDDQPFIEADAVELDKETVKRLRSLGYVN